MRFRFSELINHPNRKRSRLTELIWRSLPTLFASIVVIPLVYFNVFQSLEFFAYNNFTNWRGDRPWDNRLVIVAIDDISITKIGRFPWKRDRYAALLQKLNQSKASVVGFDILWSEASSEDQQLTALLEQSQRVVLAMAWNQSGQPLFPIEPFSNASVAVGHILKHQDSDGIVRQFDLQIQDIPSLGVAILQTYNLTTALITLLPDLSQPLYISWLKRVNDIPHFSFIDVLDGKVPTSAFDNKIVLVGVTASGIDALPTPLDRNPPASGVHLHAMVIQNLLQKNMLTIARNQDMWSLALLGSLLISLILPRKNLWIGSISAFGLAGFWLAIAFAAFSANYWMPITLPTLMFLLTGFAIAIQERFQMQRSLKIADAQIHYESTHDRLTGLYNRDFIEARLTDLLNQKSSSRITNLRRDHQCLLAILWINLHRFKSINDIYGHPIANLLLIEVGQCLQSSIAPEDSLKTSMARFGGAEFVILLENIASEQVALDIGDRLQQKLQQPFLIQGNEIAIAINIGMRFHQIGSATALLSDADDALANDALANISPEVLLRDADTAMFYAKKVGKSINKIFDKSMREYALKRLQIEKDLRKAVVLSQDLDHQDQQEFLLYYQPILSLQDMQIVGFEALIRWQHPERGLISPSYFIPLAEETGLIIPIGDWVMRNACIQLKSWQQRFAKAENITVSVNLSAKQLVQDDLFEKCLSILEQTQLDPQYLKLELTESSIMDNPNFAVTILTRLRQAGIQIYIDDFGTGYSSLSYLHKVPFDGLKIDRSFVTNIEPNSNGTEILQAIVALAQSVKAHIVAEGIESLEQLNYLQDLLVKEGDGQGFFLFRPLDIQAIEALLQIT